MPEQSQPENIIENKEQAASAVIVENIEPIKVPEVKVEDGKLIVNGQVVEKYDVATMGSSNEILKPQINNPNLFKFLAAEDSSRDFSTRVIDINQPDKEIVRISQTDRSDRWNDQKVSVNGQRWESLDGIECYYGGYRVEVDPEGRKVVFRGADKQSKGVVVVNNRIWKTTFDNLPSLATSRFGTAYAIGSNNTLHKLVVEDKEWILPNSPDSRAVNLDVRQAIVSKNGVFAVAGSSLRGGDWRDHIYIGDTTGAKHEWQNTIGHDYYNNRLIIDDETNGVAVFGEVGPNNSKEKGIILDDIIYPLKDNPDSLDLFKFENGALIIQYKDAMGEVITQKIVLNAEAREIQEINEKRKAEEEAMVDLRQLLAEKGWTSSDILKMFERSQRLEGQIDAVKRLEDDLIRARNDVGSLQTNIRELQGSKSSAEEQLRRAQDDISQLRGIITEVDGALGNATRTLGGSYKLSSDTLEKARSHLNRGKINES